MRPFFMITALLMAPLMALTPTAAFASMHREPVLTVWDNIVHFYEHLRLSAQAIVTEGPAGAMGTLDSICFSSVPPWSHVFFQNGSWAVWTTIITLMLLTCTLVVLALEAVRSAPPRFRPWPARVRV